MYFPPNFMKVYMTVSGKEYFIIQHHWPVTIPDEAGIESMIHSMIRRLKLSKNNIFPEDANYAFPHSGAPEEATKCGSYLV